MMLLGLVISTSLIAKQIKRGGTGNEDRYRIEPARPFERGILKSNSLNVIAYKTVCYATCLDALQKYLHNTF